LAELGIHVFTADVTKDVSDTIGDQLSILINNANWFWRQRGIEKELIIALSKVSY
jgi:hypothetical protein